MTMPWSKEVILRNLTSIVIGRGYVQKAMTASEILRFSLKMSLQYRLPTTIYTEQRFILSALNNATTYIAITQRVHTATELYSRCTDCIGLVLKQFNHKIGCNVSENDLLRFGNELGTQNTANATNKIGDFGELADLFESVSLVEWKNALAAAYVDLREIDRVDVEGKPHLRSVMSSLSNSSKQPASIAFIVVYSVLASFSQFERELSLDASGSQAVFCNHSVHELSHTWEQLRSDMSSNIGKSWEIHAIFDVVTKAVSQMVMNSSVFAAGDHLAAKAFLRSLKLLLPHEYAAGDNHPPNLTEAYLEDHFRMLEYEHRLMHKKTKMHVFGTPESRVHHLTLSAGNQLLVPTSSYRDLVHLSESSLMHNLPWLGTNIANFVWDLLIAEMSWTTATMKNLMALRQCFRRLHSRPSTVTSRSVGVVLALRSMINSVDQKNLYVPRTLDSRLRLSHGQFFFMRMVEKSWCDRDHSALKNVEWTEMNAALDLTPEFGEAFHCQTSPAELRSCLA